jgi:hypothetical protein
MKSGDFSYFATLFGSPFAVAALGIGI